MGRTDIHGNLGSPEGVGAVTLSGFVGPQELAAVQAELWDGLVAWQDSHAVYTNGRGMEIVQNHNTYALDLTAGNAVEALALTPRIQKLAERVGQHVTGLTDIFPTLQDWGATELSIHEYDDPTVGLSEHKDNMRFAKLIAIVSLAGECDLAVRDRQDTLHLNPTVPGDLILLRGPGLIESEEDLRPQHAVVNIRVLNRVSMMLRQNNRPGEPIPGFTFNNMMQVGQ